MWIKLCEVAFYFSKDHHCFNYLNLMHKVSFQNGQNHDKYVAVSLKVPIKKHFEKMLHKHRLHKILYYRKYPNLVCILVEIISDLYYLVCILFER